MFGAIVVAVIAVIVIIVMVVYYYYRHQEMLSALSSISSTMAIQAERGAKLTNEWLSSIGAPRSMPPAMPLVKESIIATPRQRAIESKKSAPSFRVDTFKDEGFLVPPEMAD